MRALILVDIQNDFVPGGALAVPDGDAVISVANSLMPGYDLVVATQDWHPTDHKSFAAQHDGFKIGDVIDWQGVRQVLWPTHCVQGTRGAELCSALTHNRIDEVVRKGTNSNTDSYSGFFDNGRKRATRLKLLLRERSINSVDIMGLALDYCVKFTALDAVLEGFETRLILDGCRGVDLRVGDCRRAIDEMRDAGVVIATESLPIGVA